jgi:hypothetical protein
MEVENNIENLVCLHDIFSSSFKDFLQGEYENIKININERSLCWRLAIILNESIKGTPYYQYYVDTEYNRKQNGKVKTIRNNKDQILNINPDIIIHSRWTHIKQDNLIAIEMKKSNRPEWEKMSDRERLETLTKLSYDNIWSADGENHPEHVCWYILWIYIELNISSENFLIEEYRKWEKINEYTGKLTPL